MIFETKEDIKAPIEGVFPHVADFVGFERAALRRGAEISRTDDLRAVGPGMAWNMAFLLRGKRREIDMELVQYEPPHSMCFNTRTGGVSGVLQVDLIALSRSSTRLNIRLEMKASNLTGRLLLQSLKLAKSGITNRVNAKLYEFARSTEDRLGVRTL